MNRADIEAFFADLSPAGTDRVLIPLLLIVGGLIVARLLSSVVRRLVQSIGESRLAVAEQSLASLGISSPLPQLAARVAFWGVLLLALTQAANQAELGLVTELLDNALRIAPLIGLGVAIIFIGAVAGDRLGAISGAIAERSGAMPAGLASTLVRVSAIVGASIVAFDTMGLATVLPVTVVSLFVAALLALLAAAAVLASRGVLGNIAAARYVEETFLEGEQVMFRQEPAEVQSIGILATELVTEAGAVLRVPNHLLVDEVA